VRICLFTRSLHVGGAERQLAVLAQDLAARGDEVRVLTFYEGGRIQQELRARGISCISLGKSGRWDLAGFAFRLVRELRRMRPDVIYSSLQTANVLAASLRAFVPGAALVWGIRYADLRFAFYGRLHALSVWLERRLATRADAIVANSHAGLEFCASHGYPREKLAVIENAIDTARFHPSEQRRAREREHWGITGHAPIIGMVARFDPVKRHDLFLQAAALVAARRPDVRFVLAGSSGEQLDGLRAAIATARLQELVIVLGDRADIESVYNGLDVLCSPSASEGFSNTIAEAMASGVVCVVSDVGDSARIVGEHGVVVREPTAATLADALLRGLDMQADPRALHDRIRERFSRSASLDKTLAVLAAAARQRGGGARMGALSSPPTQGRADG
jgi:glycosyltransferase involved in cell wall biosynthesis